MVAPMLTTDAEMLPSDLEKVIAKLSTDAETSLSEKMFKNEFFYAFYAGFNIIEL